MLARTADISIGGFFFALPKPPPVGTMVKFALDLDGKVVRGFGEVVWIRLYERNFERSEGMGVQFRHFRDNGEVLLRHRLTEDP